MSEPSIEQYLEVYDREGFRLISVRGRVEQRPNPKSGVDEFYFVPKYPNYTDWHKKPFTHEDILRDWKENERLGVLLKASKIFVYDFDGSPTEKVLELLRKLDTAVVLTPSGFHVYTRMPDALLTDADGQLRMNPVFHRKYLAFVRRFERLGVKPDPLATSNVNDYRYVLLPPSVIESSYGKYSNWKNCAGSYRWLNPNLSEFKIREL